MKRLANTLIKLLDIKGKYLHIQVPSFPVTSYIPDLKLKSNYIAIKLTIATNIVPTMFTIVFAVSNNKFNKTLNVRTATIALAFTKTAKAQ